MSLPAAPGVQGAGDERVDRTNTPSGASSARAAANSPSTSASAVSIGDERIRAEDHREAARAQRQRADVHSARAHGRPRAAALRAARSIAAEASTPIASTPRARSSSRIRPLPQPSSSARPGWALELGCGSGRILLELLARGVDAIGVDASAAMLAALARKAAARGLPVRACRMDIRALALRGGFAVILCPYSLVTYLTADADVDGLFAAARALLAPDGVFVVDAFVPRALDPGGGWQPDYRRPFGNGVLARWKRIAALSPQCNRIERRYQVFDAGGALTDEVEIAEDIRPFAPEALRGRLVAAGFVIAGTAWDYGHSPEASGARFFTCTARPARGAATGPRRMR